MILINIREVSFHDLTSLLPCLPALLPQNKWSLSLSRDRSSNDGRQTWLIGTFSAPSSSLNDRCRTMHHPHQGCTLPLADKVWKHTFMLHLCSTEWLMFSSAPQPAGWKLLRHHLSFLISVKSHLGLVSFSLSHYTPDLAACSPPCRAPALPLNRHFLLELFGSTLSCRSHFSTELLFSPPYFDALSF